MNKWIVQWIKENGSQGARLFDTEAEAMLFYNMASSRFALPRPVDFHDEIKDLELKRSKLGIEMAAIDSQLRDMYLQRARQNHPCACVKMNRDIGVFDVHDQMRQQRIGIGMGLVSESLSIDANCPLCGGTGVPR